MGWGGARPGAGRPKKALSEKILEGNPGKRDITVVQFKNGGGGSQLEKGAEFKIPEFLQQCGREGDITLPSSTELYRLLKEFVDSSGCSHLVASNLIEDFAHLRRAYLECEYMNRKMGRIANGKRSPYVTMAVDYSKQAMSIFDRIWSIVSQNSEQPYEGKNAFLALLTNRGF